MRRTSTSRQTLGEENAQRRRLEGWWLPLVMMRRKRAVKMRRRKNKKRGVRMKMEIFIGEKSSSRWFIKCGYLVIHQKWRRSFFAETWGEPQTSPIFYFFIFKPEGKANKRSSQEKKKRKKKKQKKTAPFNPEVIAPSCGSSFSSALLGSCGSKKCTRSKRSQWCTTHKEASTTQVVRVPTLNL